MATLHIMVGLPCSGKTKKAKQLEKQYNALLFTSDDWQSKLFGKDTGSDENEKKRIVVESILWDRASRVLSLGVDVILNFEFWTKAERELFRGRAQKLGVKFQMHYIDVSSDELFKRLEKYNKKAPPEAVITKEEMKKYISVFQPPGPEELS